MNVYILLEVGHGYLDLLAVYSSLEDAFQHPFSAGTVSHWTKKDDDTGHECWYGQDDWCEYSIEAWEVKETAS